MSHYLRFALPLMALLLSGCASWKTIPHDGTIKDTQVGYDVYRPEPYLLVVRGSVANNGSGAPQTPANPTSGKATDNKPKAGDAGGDVASQVTVKIIYLPNYTKAYRLSSSNFLAKADFVFNITDGWQLNGIADKSDNTTAITTLGSVLTSVIPALLTVQDKGPPTVARTGSNLKDNIALYKIVLDKETVSLCRVRMSDE